MTCSCTYVHVLGRVRSRPVARLGCGRHVPTSLPVRVSDTVHACHVRTARGPMLVLHDGAGVVHARLGWWRS